MKKELLNCWEMKKCERQKGGKKASELGECIASKEGMGHSCWAVAGTLCGGEIQGTIAQKIGYCTSCEVYQNYNRSMGDLGKLVKTNYPEEDRKYYNIMMELYNDKTLSGIV
ncbi:two-CW domain-containing protein [Thermodesulfobacteriota bacterium]